MYVISSQITLTSSQALIGPGASSVVLLCTMQSGACLVKASPAVTTSSDQSYGFTLAGQSKSGVIGLYLGGDPAGNYSPSGYYGNLASFEGVTFRSFDTAIQWGNNAWSNNFVGDVLVSNNTGFSAPAGISNSGENIVLVGVTIANGGPPINNQDGFEFSVFGLRDDYNSAPITFIGGAFHFSASHFEGTGGAFFVMPYGSGTLDIRDSTFLFDGTSGSDSDMLDLYPQSLTLVLDGLNIYSNHPVSQFVHLSGTMTGKVVNLTDGTGVANVVSPAVSEPNLVVEGFNGGAPALLTAGSFALASGAAWTTGTSAPTGACVTGSLYSNTSGAAGTTLFACVNKAWASVK